LSSRKEQKEALRQERLAREQQASQAAARKRLIGIVVASILVLGIVGALVAVVLAGGDDDGGSSGGGGGATISYPGGGQIPDQREANLAAAMKAAGCKDEAVEDDPYASSDGAHTTDPNVKYKSEPPALGLHYPEWPDDDIYEEAPPLTRVVHTLEHGRVLIWLRPDLTDEQRAQFKALYEEDPYHVIMLPREELKEPFAVSAWTHSGDRQIGHILRCNELNDQSWDAIRAFKEKYRDKGPEFVP
jgi:Spy/CpxP family protein refolding chaperone